MELQLSQRQKLILTQRMQQSLKILQMNTLDLDTYIQEAASENPLLELEVPFTEEDAAVTRLKKLEWLESMDESSSFRYDVHTDSERRELPLFEKSAVESLEDTLLLQLPGFCLPPEEERLMRRVIGNLDENGYLAFAPGQLASSMGISEVKLQSLLALLHRMEPAGVGAEDLRQCLLLQARRLKEPSPVLITLIECHLDMLAKKRLDKLAALLKVDIETVKEARRQLLLLNPKPGNGYSAYNTTPYIRPDLFVVHFEDSFQVIYNDYGQPKLEISNYYRSLKGLADPEADAYIQECLTRAKLFIHSIGQRKKTILECAGAILQKQKLFFEQGPGNLLPMALGDVADELGIHPSTVSRAVNGKYIQCQWGVFGLSDFFSRNVSHESKDTSQDMAITQLKRLIEEEDPKSPFSDQQLKERLEGLNISISRRTVAKYRELAGIPAASGRKGY